MILRFKNILSFGGDETFEIDFTKPSVGQIYGDNGIGKSNISRILKMAMYFDYPAKQDRIVNDHRENGFIEVEYKGYTIHQEYTRKHGLKKITLSGTNDDTGGLASTKEYIQKNIFVVPKEVFYNVYIPNIEKFKSFIGMSPTDSRKIRDELFHLGGINIKHEKTKKKISEIEKASASLIQKKTTIEEQNADVEDKIAKTKEEEKQNKEDLLATKEEEKQNKEDLLATKEKDLLATKEEIAEIDKQTEIKNKLDFIAELKTNTDLLEANNSKTLEEKDVLKRLEDCITVLNEKRKKHEKETLVRNKEEIVESIETTKSNLVVAKGKKIGLLRLLLVDLEQNSTNTEEYLEKLEKDSLSKQTDINKLSEKYGYEKASLESVREMLEIINLGEQCPTCKQKISSELLEKKAEYDRKKDVLMKSLVTMRNKHKDEKESLKKIDDEIEEVKKKKTNLKKQKDETEKEILEFETSGISEIPQNGETLEQMVGDIKTLSEKETELNTSLEKINEKIEDIIVDEEISSKTPEWSTREIVEDLLTSTNKKIEDLVKEGGSVETKISLLKKEIGDSKKEDLEKLFSNIPKEELVSKKEKSLSDENKLDEEISSIKTTIAVLENEIKSLKEDDDKATKALLEVLESNREQILSLDKQIEDETKDLDYYKILEYSYSESGLKKWILNKLKASFTEAINHDLKLFKLSVGFDDDFMITIYKKGRFLDQNLMSTGQRKTIDTVISINLVSLYEKKMGSGYPIIIDECLASLTPANATKLLTVIKDKIVSKGFNVKFINHGKIPCSFQDISIEVFENRNYTSLAHEAT